MSVTESNDTNYKDLALRRRRLSSILIVSVCLSIALGAVIIQVVSQVRMTSRMTYMEESLSTLRMELHRLQSESSHSAKREDMKDHKRQERSTGLDTELESSSRSLTISIHNQLKANHPFSHIQAYNVEGGYTSSYPDKSVPWINDYFNNYIDNFTQNDLFTFDENNSKMRIHVTGVYFIYVQVTFAGVENGHTNSYMNRPTCSYTLNLSHRGIDKILLYGSVTQYKLGFTIMSYPQPENGYIDVRAQDSVYQAGIFKLEPSDQLSLEMDNHSGHCLVMTHRDKTYLGAFRLSSL